MSDRGLPPAAHLLHSAPEQRVGLSLPLVLSERVDALVALAEASGERTSRKELIAAVLLDAPADGTSLASKLHAYRLATVEEARLSAPTSPYGLRKPGPRPRRQPPTKTDAGAREGTSE